MAHGILKSDIPEAGRNMTPHEITLLRKSAGVPGIARRCFVKRASTLNYSNGIVWFQVKGKFEETKIKVSLS